MLCPGDVQRLYPYIYIKPPTAHPSNSLFCVKLYEHIYIPQIILLNHIPNAFCLCYCQQCLVPSVTKHRTRSHLTFPPGTEHGRGRRGFNPPKTTESQFLYTCMSTFACNIYIYIYLHKYIYIYICMYIRICIYVCR